MPVPEHFDVLIVGAGISGIDGAYHLKKECPGKSFVMLEALESFGGTWHWHKYPGIRSDSDLYTFGYGFKPWIGAPIATAAEILKYLGDVIAENDLVPHIRYRHRVAQARWSSTDNLWYIEASDDKGRAAAFTCNFLWMCQGYYRHAEGYTPDWPGMDEFRGPVVHPQTWPEGLNYANKRVLVIGSGATAATLVPAMAPDSAHVTMLQRSPTYFFPDRNRNRLADTLRELDVDEEIVHDIVRRKIVRDQAKFLERAIADPETVKADMLRGLSPFLSDAEIEKNFTPNYRPWRQRIALVPDADLFRALQSGKASVVTDEIARFTETGVQLKSGKEIATDIVVTATGFNICPLGDVRFIVDGKTVTFSETVTYRGMMFTGLPNLVWIFGYFRAASWTLKADLVARFVCRLLNAMGARGAKKVSVELRPEDEGMELAAWVDTEVFNPGYLQRGMQLLPRRGNKPEWEPSQDYVWEKEALPRVSFDDPIFVFRDTQTAPAENPAERKKI
ncbi:MAG TPA: NAD(P)/FAD-dependent oxidoreductase [Rhizomicrobium sp.]|jgi:cation diffusion facilitator CzcD-associated flavoprotein CzcO